MSNKRKDSNKRVLYTGESQRKDGTYMYRYTDIFGVRQCVYAPTLTLLRQKEEAIKRDLQDGIATNGSKITVEELLNLYIKSNRKWKDTTKAMKVYNVDRLKTYPIAKMQVKDVKVSHIKQLMIDMNDSGITRNSLRTYMSILKITFQIAVDDDLIRKNPCSISLDFLPDESRDRNIISYEDEERFLDFISQNVKSDWLHDVLIVLIETGIRVGELCGLTVDNVNLKERTLHVDHQLYRDMKKNSKEELWHISVPKTKNANRNIYLSDRAYNAFSRLLERRNKYSIEPIIDGYKKFLLLDKNKWKLITNSMVRYEMEKAISQFNKAHKDQIPRITPHCCRHTFCTRMAEKGISSNSLQYLMGHAKIATTVDIYTHWNGSLAINEMQQIFQSH